MGRSSRTSDSNYGGVKRARAVCWGVFSAVYMVSDGLVAVACILAVSRHAVLM